jgi:hypothetical protein
VIQLSSSCDRHRPLLVDFVDRGEVHPETPAALAHLDRCDRCTDAIESTVLTITALRRLGAAAVGAEPGVDAWPRLRARIERRQARRSAVMSPLTGIAMSFAIVALFVVPFQLGGGMLLRPSASPAIDRPAPADLAGRRIETAYIAAVRHTETSTKVSSLVGQTASAFNRIYPDDIRPARKEVGPAPMAVRPSEAS